MAEQLILFGTRLLDKATFRNYYAGRNLQVMEFLEHWTVKNELFAYLSGNKGVGKTHLLQACCHQVNQQGLNAIYLPMEEKQHFSPNVFEDLENLDLVAIDDVQQITGDAAWEEALFHLYNRMRAANKRLIISSNLPASELNVKLADLASRLAWGIAFHLQRLTDEEKILALQMRANARGMKLPVEVANYLFTRYSRDMSDLFFLLDTLDKASLAEQRKLTIPFIRDILPSKN